MCRPLSLRKGNSILTEASFRQLARRTYTRVGRRSVCPIRDVALDAGCAGVATGLALVAIVVGGLMFAPRGRSQTHRVGVNFGVGMASKDTGRKLAHFDRELNAGRTPIPPHLHREELN